MSIHSFEVPLDPADDEDYLFNWGEFLDNEGDSIASAELFVTPVENPLRLIITNKLIVDVTYQAKDVGCTRGKEVSVADGGVQAIYAIADGSQNDADFKVSGKIYSVRCEITMSSGRVKNQTRGLKVLRPSVNG